ncbi:ATP-dependent sacrificial sulfur transferase LarE [Roseimaritima sediminicola]|uniref:ATP-dependent sacrificial sulfur transferase LarE n=1 Tax=Roseimaritima sediminicola TaxID=2662066 RepID=UPI0012984A8A|nr:ATP-dependent sacrificial sulfur transferase LarE [Roseimaritima sediminicola]
MSGFASTNSPPSSPDIHQVAAELVARLGRCESCVVAFSGGVDSAVVASAAARALGSRALAVTAVSPSLSAAQLKTARRVAAEIGIEHREVATDEIHDPAYVKNDNRRCFYCKQTLYQHLQQLATALGTAEIVSGTNADDTQDYRPGIQAGRQARVRTPLADLGIDKAGVRQLAALWGLSVRDAPASPCLSSRLAYGVAVTPERLAMVEAAEAFLDQHGFSPLRVRLHAGELARIEVAPEAIVRLLEPPLWQQTVAALRAAGFRTVTVDLEGFRSGNLNQLVTLSPPAAAAPAAAAPAAAVPPAAVPAADCATTEQDTTEQDTVIAKHTGIAKHASRTGSRTIE